MEGANSFEKGLHRSNSPQMQPEGSYVDALNWIRNDSGRLINEDLENIVHTFSEETVLLGHCPIKNEFICFLKSYNTTDGIWNSIIGTFSEGTYTEIFNDKNHTYKLNFTNSIDSVARIVSSGNRVTYFVEDGNPIRRFDLESYLNDASLYDTFEDFNLQLTVKYPNLSTTISTGGTLTASAYSFISRYADNSNNKTPWNIPSRIISIVPGDSLQEDDGGAPPDTTTDKRIQIKIQNSDLNYPFIEIAVIKYEGLVNTKVIKTLGLFRNDSVITVNLNSDSDLGDNIDISNVNDVPIYYNSAKCIEQKDNILLISNLTVKKYDDDFQEIANNIVVTTYIENVPIDNKRGINVRGNSVSVDDLPTQIPQSSGDLIGFGTVDYNNEIDQFYGKDGSEFAILDNRTNTTNLYKNSSLKKGFQPDEVYSFSITPIYKDGSIGFAYHIPCNRSNFTVYPNTGSIYQTTKIYESTFLYPLDMNMGPPDTKIRHHRMPSMSLVGNDNSSVNILRVKFFNITIPDSVKTKIQGYIIGFQQRNKDSNTSIVDEGIAIPYNYWSKDGKYYNGVLNGRGRFFGDFANNLDEPDAIIATGPSHPYAMYYSPSSEVGLEIKEGFKFNIHRNAKQYYYNTTAAAANKYFTRPSILRHTSNLTDSWTYDAQFFDSNQYENVSGNTSPILTSLRGNGDYSPFNSNVIDGKVVMGGGTNFTHIETEGSIWENLSNDYNMYPQFFRDPTNVEKQKSLVALKGISQQYLAIARITNPIDNQYGNIYNAEYLVAETVLDTSQSQVEVEGDTYTFKHWFHIRSIHKQNINGTERYMHFDFVAGVWLNSQNNFALRHRESDEGLYYPETKTFFAANTPNLTELFNNFWYFRSLGYNKQYSALNNTKLNFPKPLLFSENNVFTNRTIYSKQAFESELSDQYRVFPSLQFHDVPKDRGAITDTFVFNNNFFIHTEYGLWQAYFNPNTTQATSQGQVVLGNAGIFTIPSKLILDIKGGYMGTLDKSGINTPFGRIFIDHSQKKIFLFAGDSPVEISDLGLFSFFRENIYKNRKYNFGYDWKNKRILLSLIKEYSNDLSAVVNNAEVENISLFTDYTTLDKAKNLQELDTPIKVKTYETIVFKTTLKETKYIILDIRVTGSCNLNIYKTSFSGNIEFFKKVPLPTSNYIDTVYYPGTVYEYVSRTYYFDRYIEELEEGEYYFEVIQEDLTQQGVFSREINIISRVKEYPSEFAISYYPKTQTWTSLHSFAPSSYLTINSSSYAWKNNSFYNLSNEDGIKKNSYITLVENTVPDAFKRFDRMEINTMSGGNAGVNSPGFVEPNSYIFNDKSFTHIHCWTDRQNSKELSLAYSHDYEGNFLNGYDVNKIPVNYYRSSFHLELPLDAVVNPNINIFDDNNLDLNADFRPHMKGKFLYTKLSYNEDKPLVLNYIKTFFKPSVA
jgi:hypothetical protein